MRVTSLMLQNTGLLNINKNYRAIDKMTYQGSTMKKVQYSSDSPIDTVNQMKYKTENSKIEQYLVNLKDAQDWTNLTESVMRQSKEVLDRIRTLTVQAGNDSYSAEDRAKIADEVNQLLEALVDQSNTTIGGSYLFSGTEILKDAPFQITRGTDATGKLSNVITKVEYTGDYQEIIREIEKFTTIKVNENGNEVFMALPQKIQIPSSLNDASAKLNLLNGLAGAQRGYFQINDTKIYYDTTNDSLLDLKNKINAADNGVIAEITGKLTGSVSFADSSSALNLSGRFVLNGQAINVVSSDSLAGIAEKINNLTKTTGVSAEITVDNRLVLK
ncbi:MAG TPA: flagellar hook-associated protein FlgL, partial [bacterium]|nr:flagellar hook-associated protein FlgL [bacterium]